MNDCDIFEVAEELYRALGLALHALNEVPNRRIRHDDYSNTYAVASEIERVLRNYKDRI